MDDLMASPFTKAPFSKGGDATNAAIVLACDLPLLLCAHSSSPATMRPREGGVAGTERPGASASREVREKSARALKRKWPCTHWPFLTSCTEFPPRTIVAVPPPRLDARQQRLTGLLSADGEEAPPSSSRAAVGVAATPEEAAVVARAVDGAGVGGITASEAVPGEPPQPTLLPPPRPPPPLRAACDAEECWGTLRLEIEGLRVAREDEERRRQQREGAV